MFQVMTSIQQSQEPWVHGMQDPDDVRCGVGESWRDIADRYQADHTGPEALLSAVENLLLELAESLSARADREAATSHHAFARRTGRYVRGVYELYRQAESPTQAQMAVAALTLGAPQWLFDDEDGEAWRREITALGDYAGWAVSRHGELEGPDGTRGGLD